MIQRLLRSDLFKLLYRRVSKWAAGSRQDQAFHFGTRSRAEPTGGPHCAGVVHGNQLSPGLPRGAHDQFAACNQNILVSQPYPFP